MASETEDILVTTRVNKALYGKILDRQRKAKALTGIEPSVAAVIRAMLEEASADKRGRNGAQRAAGGR